MAEGLRWGAGGGRGWDAGGAQMGRRWGADGTQVGADGKSQHLAANCQVDQEKNDGLTHCSSTKAKLYCKSRLYDRGWGVCHCGVARACRYICAFAAIETVF